VQYISSCEWNYFWSISSCG